MPAPAAEPISFAEFARQKSLSSLLQRGFETHVRGGLGNFNYRTRAEWDAEFTAFMSADRRRRPHV